MILDRVRDFEVKFFLRLRGFQHGPSRAHIEAQPIAPFERLGRDTNDLMV